MILQKFPQTKKYDWQLVAMSSQQPNLNIWLLLHVDLGRAKSTDRDKLTVREATILLQ